MQSALGDGGPAAGAAPRSPVRAWLFPMFLLLLAVLAAGWFSVHDFDIGLHARTGQWIVEHGRVPTVNVMSRLHADYPTVDDKWGFQVLAHLLFDGAGPDACIAARLLLLLLLFGSMAATARRLGAGSWSTLVFLLLALVAGRSRFTLRPDLLSALLTVVMVHLLLVRHPDGRGAWWLVPLQLLWVNVHGYFITGPLLLGAVAAGQALSGPAGRAAARRLLPVGAAMLVVCLANPAGLDGALHPLAILQDLHAHADFYRSAIIEFRPTLADDPRQPVDRLAYAALGLLAVPALLARAAAAVRAARARAAAPAPPAKGAQGPPVDGESGGALSALALCALFGAMSFSLRRNMAPFAFVVAPLAAAAWSRHVVPRRWRVAARGTLAAGAGALAGTGLALLVAWGEVSDATSIHDGLDRRFGSGLSRIAYPDAGIDFIARELPDASVFTAFSWGSTFTGRRWPAQVASTDGNTHGYPTSYLMEVMSALSGEDIGAFQRLCDRDGHDVALLPMAGPLSVALLADPRWMLACVGLREAVWVRRSACDPGWLARHDLLALWRGGAPAGLPGTPLSPRLRGLPRVHVPLAEVDQATLLLAAGLPYAALGRAGAGIFMAPDHGEALALAGVAYARLGRKDEARALLEESLHGTGYNRLQDAARELLARL